MSSRGPQVPRTQLVSSAALGLLRLLRLIRISAVLPRSRIALTTASVIVVGYFVSSLTLLGLAAISTLLGISAAAVCRRSIHAGAADLVAALGRAILALAAAISATAAIAATATAAATAESAAAAARAVVGRLVNPNGAPVKPGESASIRATATDIDIRNAVKQTKQRKATTK